jgi:hypothetical protein
MLIRLRRTALSKTPHALADGLMLVFEHPVTAGLAGRRDGLPGQPPHGERRLAFWLVQDANGDRRVISHTNMSFRAQRETFRQQRIENSRFLPVVEMTDSLNAIFSRLSRLNIAG